MKLITLIREVAKESPDKSIALKTERYGTFWVGKAKFAGLACYQTASAKVLSFIEREDGVSITIS